MFRYFTGVCLLLLTATSQLASAAPARFSAVFRNGETVQSDRITDWYKEDQSPRIDGKLLFDDNNPIRTLHDREAAVQRTPEAFLETFSGDRLPGVVEQYVSTRASYEPVPAHLVLKPAFELRPPTTIVEPRIRVLPKFVRRIVWQQTGEREYQPGRIFYRDGRTADFRAARFNESSVTLLAATGVSRAFFAEIAELHMPSNAASEWDHWFDELAILAPNGEDTLFQWETIHGGRLTASLQRFTATVKGNPADIDRWVHAAQPAWSLDIIWIASGEIWRRVFFAAHEAPLLRVSPTATTSSAFGGARTWRRDKNVSGGMLTGDGKAFAWGAGVHGSTTLRFPLPPCAATFTTSANLDDTTGDGGCVRVKIRVVQNDDQTGKELYSSGFVTGKSENLSSGMLDTGESPEGQSRTLLLEVDQAHEGRPAGADPLNIRDRLNWLEPLLTFTPEDVKQRLKSRTPGSMHAWNEWEWQAGNEPVWEHHYKDMDDGLGRFRTLVSVSDNPLLLRRKVELPADNSRNFLMLAVASTKQNNKAARLEVRIDGQAIGEYEVPVRNRRYPMPEPIAVKLDDFAGNEVELEIAQMPRGERVFVEWSAIRFSPHLPALAPLLEDSQKFVAVENGEGENPGDAAGKAVWFDEDHHSGKQCLKLTPAGDFHYELDEPLLIRADPGWGEFRHLRFAFRKFGKGRISLELNGATRRGEPIRYDAGTGEPVKGEAKRVWVQNLPSEWIVMTRDLWSEFGDAEITGITLSAVDGEYALFDHIYLGRTADDFRKIVADSTPEDTNRNARRELVQHVLDKVLPATVAYKTADGRTGTGVIINDGGEILTAGHVIAAPGKDVTVYLHDGRQLQGKTAGIFRELDLGMIKINDEKPLPFAAVNEAEDLSESGLYVGASYTSSHQEKDKPVTYINGVRRVFRQLVWGSYQTKDYSTGAPLFDEGGRVVGIHFRTSRYGGFMYTRVNAITRDLQKMRRNEIWGKWPPASAPVLGVQIESIRAGAKVTEVSEDSAAAKAGVKTGDIFNKVDDRSVVSLDDIYEVLADNDVGDTVQVELSRDGKKQTLQLKLSPRTP